MPTSPTTTALDSLRTVEFRQTLRGYHIDDVDEYLERVAVEAEALHEQLRQSADRLRQATERIVALEAQPRDQQPAPAAEAPPAAADDSLQRTLMLAQKFVEQTETEAKAQARVVVDEAEQRARELVSEAEERARVMAEQSEKRLREEVARLESLRIKLAGDVEAITGYLEGERTRLRGALGEMLHWIDENVQPTAAAKPPAAERPGGPEAVRPSPEMAGSVVTGPPRPGLQPVTQTSAPNGTR